MEKQQPDEVELSKREQIIRGADRAPKFYANYFQLTATKGDLRLRFGQVDAADDKKFVADVVADVYIAPEHLKDFIGLMNRKLRDYAEKFPGTPWTEFLAEEDAKAQAD